MVTLKNRTSFAQVYNLPHQENCGNNACHCRKIQVPIVTHDPVTGTKGVRQEARLVGESLTFQPGEVKQIPRRHLACAEVAEAITRRDLVEIATPPSFEPESESDE